MSRDAVIAALTAARPGRHRRPRRVGRRTDGGRWPTPRTTSARCGCTPAAATRCSTGRTPWRARTRWPSCPTSGRSPRPGRGSPPTTPTRMPRSGSSRCSPTRTAAPTSRRPHPAPLLPRRGRPPRRARLARRHPVPGAAGARRRRASRRGGYVDDHARLVDVGPTLAPWPASRTTTCATREGEPLDGRVLTAYLERCPRGGSAGSSASCGTARTAATCSTSPRPGSCPASRGSSSAGSRCGAVRWRSSRASR